MDDVEFHVSRQIRKIVDFRVRTIELEVDTGLNEVDGIRITGCAMIVVVVGSTSTGVEVQTRFVLDLVESNVEKMIGFERMTERERMVTGVD